MGLFDELFGGGGQEAGGDIAAGAQQGIDTQKQFLERALGLLSPFQSAGVSAIPQIQSLISQQQDPTQFIGNILSKFQESPGEKFVKSQALGAAQQAAEASGQQGSGAESEQLEKLAGNIASQGQQQFLNNVFGVQQNRQNLLQSLLSSGLSAAGQGASTISTTGTSIADLLGQKAQGQAEAAESKASGMSNLFGDIIGGIGSFLF